MVEDSQAPDAFVRLREAVARLHEALDALPPDSAPGYARALTDVVVRGVPPVHAAYDACVGHVLRSEGRKVTCRPGCSACCRHYVSSVEPFELIALDAHLKTRPDYADLVLAAHRRAERHAGLVARELERRPELEPEEASDRALHAYFLRGIPCPFLGENGHCGVYEHRPMACRMFFAESHPRYCEGRRIASPWNRNFQVELPLEAEEALARCARLLEHLGLPEDLFAGIAAVNARLGHHDPGRGEGAV